jgi:precorrin-6x reductase
MADHDIQKSKHLLKRLDEEIIFLSSLLDQAKNLLDQSKFVVSDVRLTQTEIRYTLRENSKEQL